MDKLYEYWLDNYIIPPVKVRNILGYRIVNAIFGKYFSYVLGHERLKGQVTHYRGMWKTTSKNRDAILKELHQHIAYYGELPKEGDDE